MISFLTTTESPKSAPQGEAYVEALSRLESLRRTVASMDCTMLEVRDLDHAAMPKASKAAQIAFAEQMEAAARQGLAAVTAASRVDVSKGGKLADSLRQGGIDLDKLLTL